MERRFGCRSYSLFSAMNIFCSYIPLAVWKHYLTTKCTFKENKIKKYGDLLRQKFGEQHISRELSPFHAQWYLIGQNRVPA